MRYDGDTRVPLKPDALKSERLPMSGRCIAFASLACLLVGCGSGQVKGKGPVAGTAGFAGVAGTHGILIDAGVHEAREGADDIGGGARDAQPTDAEGFDAGGDARTKDAGPSEPSWPKPCADLYDPEVLPTFDLTFTSQTFMDIQNDCASTSQVYRPVQLTHDGVTVDARVRLKGNWSWRCSKMQFVVSFNEIDKSGRFHGLRKLVFDAPWYDRTMLHERLVFPLFEQRGLPYSCVNHAKLYIDGEYYGLYANVERLDKENLQRHFEEDDGNLYQGGVELKTNEAVPAPTRRDALLPATRVAEIEALVDLDQAVAEWATEAMLPAMDNYWAGVEINYYLYDHPSRGFLWLPYDMDIVFSDGAYEDGSLIWPNAAQADPIAHEHSYWGKEALFQLVMTDDHWCERFVDELVLARALYSPEAMSAQVDAWSTQIRQALDEDPNKPFTMEDHDASIATLKAFFATRAQAVDQWLMTNHCPAMW